MRLVLVLLLATYPLLGFAKSRASSLSDIYTILSTYLPYSYLDNNDCYARADYVAMELAAAGTPSRPAIVSSCGKTDDLIMLSTTGHRWIYHTAPMIFLGDEPFIIDPSFADEPIAHEDWLRAVNSTGRPYYTLINYNSDFSTGYGQAELCDTRAALPTQISQLPLFIESNLPISCALMWSDIDKLADKTPQQKNAMRDNLLLRTIYLWEKLRAWNLFVGFPVTHEEIVSGCMAGVPEK